MAFLKKTCPVCDGKGSVHGGWMKCHRCRGTGKVNSRYRKEWK